MKNLHDLLENFTLQTQPCRLSERRNLTRNNIRSHDAKLLSNSIRTHSSPTKTRMMTPSHLQMPTIINVLENKNRLHNFNQSKVNSFIQLTQLHDRKSNSNKQIPEVKGKFETNSRATWQTPSSVNRSLNNRNSIILPNISNRSHHLLNPYVTHPLTTSTKLLQRAVSICIYSSR